MADSVTFPAGYLETDKGSRLVVATTLMLVFTTALLLIRIYARNLASGSRGWDDFLLPPAWLLFVGLCTVMYLNVPNAGVGRHVQAVAAEDPKKIVKLTKFIYLLDWFYVPANMLSRISVVLLYLRIFTGKLARTFAWAVFAFLVGNCIATIIAAQIECTPLAYTWDKTIKGGHCFNLILWYKLTNFPNVIADVSIMLLPVQTVWTLHTSLAQKLGITLVCVTGSVGLIASCIRTIEFFVAPIATDITWGALPALTWTVVECGMYFSAACLVGLRPLFSKMPQWLKSHLGISKGASRPTGGSVRVNHSRSARQWPGGKKSKYKDLDSITNIMNMTVDGEVELGDVPVVEVQDLKSIEEDGRIHVKTQFDVESMVGDARYKGFEFP